MFLPYFNSTKAAGTKAINTAIGMLYRSGFWLKSDKARVIGRLIFAFLSHFAICASITLRAKKRRFSITPKNHMIAHDAHQLLDEATRSSWCQNPLARSNQIQEDFIGRPSRISRRVSSRSIHSSLLLRALINYSLAFKAAKVDRRGLEDAYPNI